MKNHLILKLLSIVLLVWISWANVAQSETIRSDSKTLFTYLPDNISVQSLRKNCINTDREDGILQCRKLVETIPFDPESWNNLGYKYYHLQNYEEALFAYKQAIDLDSKYSLAWANICGVLGQVESYNLALRACDRALQNDSLWGIDGKALAWDNMGNALFNLGNYQQSLDAFEHALAANPHYYNASINRSIVLNRMKQVAE